MPKKKKDGLTREEIFDILRRGAGKNQPPLSPPISDEELKEACDDLCKNANKIAEDHLAKMARSQN